MPCRDDGYPKEDLSKERQEKLDLATRLLCELCSALEQSKEGRDLFTPELSRWLREHKKVDAARKRLEKEQQKKSDLKAKALAKLTPEERAALGLH